jgi:hypothetical protein
LVTNGVAPNLLTDCNHNGVDDGTDISSGASHDCNANNIPDECELDSDGNGVIDACEPAVTPPGSPTIAPGTPDNGLVGTDPSAGTTDPSRLISPGGNEAATPQDDSTVPVVSASPCGIGSAAMLPMMALAFCASKVGRSRRHPAGR